MLQLAIKIVTFVGLILLVTCQKQPNIVLFLADDMGYGDLPLTGHPTIDAPHITKMAREGLFFYQWYSGDILCSPSRAAMLSGQYSARNGFYANLSFPQSSSIRVFYPTSTDGLHDLPTIPKVLRRNGGYATALHGKWHLGHRNGSLPTQNGFDHFWGTPFAGNQGCDKWQNTSNIPNYLNSLGCLRGWAGLPLMVGEEVVEQPLYQPSFEKRLVKQSINFLKKNKEKPVFILHAFHNVHIPLNPGPEHTGSLRGKYGDAVAEIDSSLGEVLDYIRDEESKERCTVAIFTSDNGPWLRENLDGGSAGLFRAGKGGTYEGGSRVPAIIWSNCPKYSGLKGGVNNRALVSTLDLFPTFMEIAGVPKRVWSKFNLDGFSLVPIMKGKTKKTPRLFQPYFRGPLLMAARYGGIKAHYITQDDQGTAPPVVQNPPIYYNLYTDPSEKYNLTADKIDPTILSNLNAAVNALKASLVPNAFPLFNKMSNSTLICCKSDAGAPPCTCGGKKALLGAPPVDAYTPIIPPVSQLRDLDLRDIDESAYAHIQYY